VIDVKAKLHKPFEIELRTHLTMGYEWRPMFNASVLKFLGKRRPASAKRFGASGREIFRFEPLKSGDHDLYFELVRPFEDESVERRNYALHIE
jgi:predicted secreted protein